MSSASAASERFAFGALRGLTALRRKHLLKWTNFVCPDAALIKKEACGFLFFLMHFPLTLI